MSNRLSLVSTGVYRVRTGETVTLLHKLAGTANPFPWVAVLHPKKGAETVRYYTDSGAYYAGDEKHELDIVERVR